MITIYIKQNQFAKNVDEFGNIREFHFPRYKELEDRTIAPINDYLENGFKEILLDEQYKDCVYQDFDENLEFSLDKYNARKQKENEARYEDLIVSKIRQRYSINQELAILRQQTTKPEEYQEYFDYVEQCKAEAKSEVLNDNNTIN